METDDLNRLIRSLNAPGELVSGDATGDAPLLEHVRGEELPPSFTASGPGPLVADGGVSAEEDPAPRRARAAGFALRPDESGARPRPRHRCDRVGKDDDPRRHQQLVPRADGKGRVVATEVLVATDGVRAHLRKGSFHQLHTELTLGRRFGMMTMEDSLARLVKAGTISEAEARLRSAHPDDLVALLR